MKPNNLLIISVLFVSLFLGSCASQSVFLKKGYDFSQVRRIAVIQFKDPTSTGSTGSMVSQLFMKYFLESGYNVVERDELDAIMREKQLSDSNLLNPDTVKQFKLSGIDAIVTGTVTRSYPESELYEGGYVHFTAAQVGLTCRMIDVSTGELLWAGSDTYDAMNTQTAFDYLTSSLVNDLVSELDKASKAAKLK